MINWQRLRRPQITLRVMFTLTTLVAVGVWYYNRQSFKIEGNLSSADFVAIRQLVRSHEILCREPVVTLKVRGLDEVELTTDTQDSPNESHGFETKLMKKNGIWETDGFGGWMSMAGQPVP